MVVGAIEHRQFDGDVVVACWCGHIHNVAHLCHIDLGLDDENWRQMILLVGGSPCGGRHDVVYCSRSNMK